MGRYNYHGLDVDQVESSREAHGSNELPPPEVETFWEKLWDNFNDPLIKILVVALVITLALSFMGYAEWFESLGIASAVFIATFVSTYSEHKNEESFQALQSEASRTSAHVFRSGQIKRILTSDIVVGDYVQLQPGEIVPADGILVAGHILLNESSLTGESEPAVITPSHDDADHGFDASGGHPVRRSCVVHDGEGVMLVSKVGIHTDYGHVAAELAEGEERESPLQVKLSALADGISRVGYFGASAIAISFLFKQFVIDNHWSWTQMMAHFSDGPTVIHEIVKAVILGIIVIVVAVPEGLPMMIAIVLSLNMKRLLNDKVHVRKLLGIETAGSISILFADKTGTMTKGRFEPVLFLSGSFTTHPTYGSVPTPLAQVLQTTLLVATESSYNERTGEFIGGNPSDQAALAFVPHSTLKGAVETALEIAKIHPTRSIMFNSARKFSATSLILPDYLAQRVPELAASMEGHITFVKGAPENLLPHCSHYYSDDGQLARLADPEALLTEINIASNRGTRVILIATASELLDHDYMSNDLPSSLHLVGIVGIKDEVRPTTKGALASAREAGIQTIMITGDKRETAVAVAHEVGLLDDYGINEAITTKGIVVTSEELRQMSDSEVTRLLPSLRVVARALPFDKARLVQLAQARGEVVGMTGDGTNDAPALKMADVGFAMGSGVDVAKEAADVVVLDDNFSSTMKAVLYGRTIFKSIRKFIVFQSTMNLSSMVIVFMGPILGFDFPLTLIQLLWVNLVMDTLAALAFGGEVPHLHTMREKPIVRHAAIISPYMWSAIVFNGLYTALLSIIFLTWDRIVEFFTREGLDVDSPTVHTIFLTGFFCFFIFIANFNAFNARTTSANLIDGLTTNKNFVAVVSFIFGLQWLFTYIGGSILRTVPLTRYEWLLITSLAATIVPVDLIRKLVIVPFMMRRHGVTRNSNLV